MESEFLRTQNLGIEFFQGGVRCPIFMKDPQNGQYSVLMSPKPFELRFPNIEELDGVKICVSLDDSIFDPTQYTDSTIDLPERRYFWPGTGMADAKYSSASLRVNPEACNYLDVDGRLVLDGNYGKIIYRNYSTGEAKQFFYGLKIFLAFSLQTSVKYRQQIEEVILDFTFDPRPKLSTQEDFSGIKKTLKIFIASSIELKEERKLIEDYIDRENKILNKKNVFLETVIWEDFDDSVSATRKQDDYNRAILESDIVLSIFFTKAGNFTVEEFQMAYQNYLKHRKPIIYTYFKKGQVDIDQVTLEGLKTKEAFLEFLEGIGHFPTYFTSSENLIIKFGRQLDIFLSEKNLL